MKKNTHGNHIAKIRREKGMSEQELAQKAGISEQRVKKIENGSDPWVSEAAAIAKALDASIGTLFEEK